MMKRWRIITNEEVEVEYVPIKEENVVYGMILDLPIINQDHKKFMTNFSCTLPYCWQYESC